MSNPNEEIVEDLSAEDIIKKMDEYIELIKGVERSVVGDAALHLLSARLLLDAGNTLGQYLENSVMMFNLAQQMALAKQNKDN